MSQPRYPGAESKGGYTFPMPSQRIGLKTPLRLFLAGMMIAAGALHFVTPNRYVPIVPAFLPSPLELVYVSGFFEILGGVGLLVARTRRWAAWGLIAFYVAVLPANVNMAVHRIGFDGPSWVLWLRLPLQAVLIAWAWWFTRPDDGACAPDVV